MGGRQHTWSAVLGAALAGGAVCGALAWYGRLGLAAACAAALIVWIARRVIDAAPPGSHARPGPTAWSPYDRRRSGRPATGLHLWRRLRPRRRSEAPAAPPRLPWDPRTIAPPTDATRKRRERDAH